MRNPQFVGREVIIGQIKQQVETARSHRRLGIFGLGGIGKSELAIEVAHRLAGENPDLLVLFIRADSEAEFECTYVKPLQFSRTSGPESPVSNHIMSNKIAEKRSGRWVLIIDGVDGWETLFGPKSLIEHLPGDTNGTIIFTSRDRDLIAELVQFDSTSLFHLDRFSEESAIELLSRVSQDFETDISGRGELVKELEYLPLAVMQAAVFIRTKPVDIRDYLSLCRGNDTERFKLLDIGTRIKDIEFSAGAVTKSWATTFEQLERNFGYAAQVLAFIACLHPHAIPYWLLPVESGSWIDLISALGLLEAHSLIYMNGPHQVLNAHSLVHFVFTQRLKANNTFTTYAQRAYEAVYQTFPSSFRSRALLMQAEGLISHAGTVLNNSRFVDIGHLDLGLRVSLYLHTVGRFDDSLRYAERLFEKSRILSGESSYMSLKVLSELALVHQSQGNYDACQNITEVVLDRRKRIMACDHPDVLGSLNNLGLILQKKGKWREAETIHREALKVKERVLGPNHDSTIKSMNNLALTLQDQEKYKEAEEYFRTAADVRQEVYGKLNTTTLLSFNNLAVILQLQDRFAEAGQIYAEVFDARSHLLGARHHATLRTRGNMALNLLQQEEHTKAEDTLIEVLEGFVETLGRNHLESLNARANLANAVRHRNKLQDAERMYKEVFEARKELLGVDHPQTKLCEKLANELELELECAKG
ncbi:TPR-like protein [Lophiostoma macrostomum CBS 122681]|uniref:TPR-like protein n=1 Tax=Lophiostoma macrostomum CBS 122681 TaxID=1314788 RepID=A0A6A6TMC1_9PLEO|nr:TPR-like protein [Lophiostoma macrostomum CBS 122681]